MYFNFYDCYGHKSNKDIVNKVTSNIRYINLKNPISLYILVNLCVWGGGLGIFFSTHASTSFLCLLCVCSCVKDYFLVPSFENMAQPFLTLYLNYLILSWS